MCSLLPTALWLLVTAVLIVPSHRTHATATAILRRSPPPPPPRRPRTVDIASVANATHRVLRVGIVQVPVGAEHGGFKTFSRYTVLAVHVRFNASFRLVVGESKIAAVSSSSGSAPGLSRTPSPQPTTSGVDGLTRLICGVDLFESTPLLRGGDRNDVASNRANEDGGHIDPATARVLTALPADIRTLWRSAPKKTTVQPSTWWTTSRQLHPALELAAKQLTGSALAGDIRVATGEGGEATPGLEDAQELLFLLLLSVDEQYPSRRWRSIRVETLRPGAEAVRRGDELNRDALSAAVAASCELRFLAADAQILEGPRAVALVARNNASSSSAAAVEAVIADSEVLGTLRLFAPGKEENATAETPPSTTEHEGVGDASMSSRQESRRDHDAEVQNSTGSSPDPGSGSSAAPPPPSSLAVRVGEYVWLRQRSHRLAELGECIPVPNAKQALAHIEVLQATLARSTVTTPIISNLFKIDDEARRQQAADEALPLLAALQVTDGLGARLKSSTGTTAHTYLKTGAHAVSTTLLGAMAWTKAEVGIGAEAEAQTGSKFIVPLAEPIMKALSSPVVDIIGGLLGDALGNDGIADISGQVTEAQLTHQIEAYLMDGIPAQMLLQVKPIAMALAARLETEIPPPLVEKITTSLEIEVPDRMTRIIDKLLGKDLPRRIDEKTPKHFARLLTRDLTHALGRSLADSIVPTLVQTVSHNPMQDYYCYYCYTFKKYCQYCTYSPLQLYYAMYAVDYYGQYYTSYYADYFVEKIGQGNGMEEVDSETTVRAGVDGWRRNDRR